MKLEINQKRIVAFQYSNIVVNQFTMESNAVNPKGRSWFPTVLSLALAFFVRHTLEQVFGGTVCLEKNLHSQTMQIYSLYSLFAACFLACSACHLLPS